MTAAPIASRPFPAAFSAHLDALRAVAALWVALSHLRSWDLAAAPVAAWLPLAGHDAVIIFFVLSGFLICHAAARTTSPIDFAIDRAARLWSVAAPVLVATWLLDLAMARVAPDAYAGHYEWAKPWIYLPLHLLFLGEAWSLREAPQSIPPYWSLHYEAWYYVAFAALLFLRGWLRVGALLALAAILGPKLLLLWPVWLLGAALYLLRPRLQLSVTAARLLLAACLAVYAALEITGLDHRLWLIGDAAFTGVVGSGPGNARHFLADYILAGVVGGLLVGLERGALALPPVLARAAHAAAGYSFTLYLVHGPYLLTLRNLIDTSRLGVLDTVAIFLGLLATTVVVGQVTEKRLGAWRRALRIPLARLRAAA